MFGNADGTFRDVEYEEVKNMPVMDSCIREALRLVSFFPCSSYWQLSFAQTLSTLPVPHLLHLFPTSRTVSHPFYSSKSHSF